METFLKIKITPAKNGIKVEVGCHEFVYQQENVGSFLKDLDLYLHDPEAARKLVFKRWGISEEASPTATPERASDRVVDVGQDEAKEVRETTQEEAADPGAPGERSR